MNVVKNLTSIPTSERQWLNFSQKFLHSILPRYSVYSFKRINSTFRLGDPQYMESIINFSVLYFTLLLLSLLLIVAIVLVVHLNIVEYTTSSVMLYKCVVAIFGFLAFLCTIMAFISFTMVSSSISHIIQNQVVPGQEVIKEFQDNLKIISDNVFGLLSNIEQTLAGTTEQPKEKPGLFNKIVGAIKDLASQKLGLPVVRGMLKGKIPVDKLINDVGKIVLLLEMIKVFYRVFFFVFVFLLLGTFIVSLWLTSSSFSRKGTGRLVCRVPLCFIIVWWVVAAITAPFALFLSDVCVDPVRFMASIFQYLIPSMDTQIVMFYLGCVEPNPIKWILDIIVLVTQYILGPIARGFLYLVGDSWSQLRPPIEIAELYFKRLKDRRGCEWSSLTYRLAFDKGCTTLLMGLMLMTLAATLIAFFLTFSMMAALKLRDFKGWPATKKTAKYTCPSTCKVHEILRRKIPPCPVPVVRRVSSTELAKPVHYDRRGTCPETCRGYDESIAQPTPRATCPKECKGMIQLQQKVPKVTVEKVKRYKKLEYKKKISKGAICCIELPDQIECIPVSETKPKSVKGFKDKLKNMKKRGKFTKANDSSPESDDSSPKPDNALAGNQQQPGAGAGTKADDSRPKPNTKLAGNQQQSGKPKRLFGKKKQLGDVPIEDAVADDANPEPDTTLAENQQQRGTNKTKRLFGKKKQMGDVPREDAKANDASPETDNTLAGNQQQAGAGAGTKANDSSPTSAGNKQQHAVGVRNKFRKKKQLDDKNTKANDSIPEPDNDDTLPENQQQLDTDETNTTRGFCKLNSCKAYMNQVLSSGRRIGK